MKNKNLSLHQWFFSFAGLIFLVGFSLSLTILSRSNVHLYPAMIASAYQRTRHHLMVPGERDVNLTRSGAYGIYYVHELMDPGFTEEEILPAIDCVLISRTTENVFKAVPDYVKTNRYRESGQRIGVLVMSITIDDPGIYTFSCNCEDVLNGEEIHVALGPNYFWEFLRVAWKIAGPLLGGINILCGSLVMTFLLLVIGGLIKLLHKKKSESHNQDLSTMRKSG